MEDETYHIAVRGHPMIVADRWYLANIVGKVVVVDQPAVGFATEGEARMYLQNMGRQHMPGLGEFGGKTNIDTMIVVPAAQVTG